MRMRLQKLQVGSRVRIAWEGEGMLLGCVTEAPLMVTPTRDIGVSVEYDLDDGPKVYSERLGMMVWEEVTTRR